MTRWRQDASNTKTLLKIQTGHSDNITRCPFYHYDEISGDDGSGNDESRGCSGVVDGCSRVIVERPRASSRFGFGEAARPWWIDHCGPRSWTSSLLHRTLLRLTCTHAHKLLLSSSSSSQSKSYSRSRNCDYYYYDDDYATDILRGKSRIDTRQQDTKQCSAVRKRRPMITWI